MAIDSIDLKKNYLLLEPDGEALLLPGGNEFWSQVMSGNTSDSGILRLMNSRNGRLLSVLSMDSDWTNWEMHPAGDEILFILEGQATFIFDLANGPTQVAVDKRRLLVVPKGVWHTAKIIEPVQVLAITVGAGTEHRPV